MGIPDQLPSFLQKLYAGQEATVRIRYGIMGWFQIGKRVRQGYILSPCLFNFHAEYIMQNAGLDKTQDRIKIARRNINNLRYGDRAFLVAQMVKNPPALWETWVQFLGQEDSLEKEMATHSNTLAWKIP